MLNYFGKYVYHTMHFNLSILDSSLHSEESVLKNSAADHICDVVLHFITDCLALCSNYPLDEVSEKLVHSWPSIAVAVSIMKKILSESDKAVQDSIMQVVMSYPSIFEDLILAFQIGMYTLQIKLMYICMYVLIEMYVLVHMSCHILY